MRSLRIAGKRFWSDCVDERFFLSESRVKQFSFEKPLDTALHSGRIKTQQLFHLIGGFNPRGGRPSMPIRSLFVLLLVFTLCAPLALGQVNSATISGTVRDASGAVLPGVSVAIQNQDTGISRTVITNETGRYSAPALGLGSYQVTAQL